MRTQQPNRLVLEEASTWFVEFRLGEVDKASRHRFMEWLCRSPEHIRAYIEISGAYARLPGTKPGQDAAIEELVRRAQARDKSLENIHELPPAQTGFADAARHRRSLQRVPLFGIAATVLFLCATAAGWLIFHSPPTYETQTAEQRTITLDDGSRIELNARSKVRVVFTPTQRDVRLLAGQVLFHVAKDPSRPFIVSADDTRVRAVGTQFDVNLRRNDTIVTVLEGRVSVDSAQFHQPSLVAGEQLAVTPQEIRKSDHPNIASATAWTQGQLEFDETPLADAAAEFNRFSRRPLSIDSEALATFRISGIYSVSDTQSLILFLRNQPDLIVTQTETETRVTRK